MGEVAIIRSASAGETSQVEMRFMILLLCVGWGLDWSRLNHEAKPGKKCYGEFRMNFEFRYDPRETRQILIGMAPMLPRTLEPEVMDTQEDASEYNSMNHSEVNRRFVEHWGLANQRKGISPDAPQSMLDVGTGTARIPIEFCQRYRNLKIEAIDLAAEMLKLARVNIEQAGLTDRIALQLVDGKRLPFPDGVFDTVVTNTILHHIPEPLVCLREMVRVLASGGLLFVRDLMRPDSNAEVETLVELHTQGATPSQKQLFRQSLHASLTLNEARDMLEKLQLPRGWVQATSDRHWTISGRKE